MTTKFSPALDIPQIEKHPKNPRRRATADPELVESIKVNGLIQPVVVAPLPLPEAKPGMGVPMQRYILIAGHRRLDGAKKAKLKTVPAVIRDDLVTEGQQVEAMLIENGRREDLTPIEEAEGYAQLQLFGYNQKAIAKAVGRDPKTVSARLRLVKLAKSTKDRVHKGQMTLEDALAIAEFVDDPETTKSLEKASTDGYSFKYAVQRARAKKKAEAEVAAAAADLRDRGIPEVTELGEGGTWQAFSDTDGVKHIDQTPLRDPADHDGCLTWGIYPASEYSPCSIVYGCTNPASHDGELSKEELQRREERAQADKERQERQAAEHAAEKVRVHTIVDQVGTNTTMPTALRDLTRALLPVLVGSLADSALTIYQEAVNVPADRRWESLRSMTSTRPEVARRHATRLADHIDDVDRMSDGILTRCLVTALTAVADENLQSGWRRVRLTAVRYLDLLEQLGHGFCDVDAALRNDVTDSKEKAS